MVRGRKSKVLAAGKPGSIRVEPIAWDSPQGNAARRIRLEVFVKKALFDRFFGTLSLRGESNRAKLCE